MLMGCSYYLLDSLLPQHRVAADDKDTAERTNGAQSSGRHGGEDFLRLEYLSACKIMQDVLTADRLLPHIPHRLYPALFQAIAQKQFDTWKKTGDGPHSASTLSLISLMQSWPYEAMTIRDLMPPLIYTRRNTRHIHLQNHCDDINRFCYSFLSLLPYTFLSRYACDEQLEKRSNLTKLDISGYYGFFSDTLDLKNLEIKVKKAYKLNSPSKYDKCELVIDTRGLRGDKELLNTLGVICSISEHHGASLVVKFRRVHILSTISKFIIPIIELLAKNNATEYLELEACEITDEVADKLILMAGTLTGLSVVYLYEFNSLQFLTSLPLLSQLDLSGIRLTGKLDPLLNLQQGLKYLKLVGCSLKHTELDILASSHHTKSLLEVDLSENPFSLPLSIASLCSLCMELKQVLILELENCSLKKVTPENVRSLVEVLNTLPTLRLLKLTENDFSTRVICEHLPHLANNKALQYLSLTIPSDAYLSDDYNMIQYEFRKLKYEFIKRVQTLPESQLHVEWTEEISYSHWYYSV